MFTEIMEGKKTENDAKGHNRLENSDVRFLNGKERYELLCRYEEENRSFEEICTLLDMRKGEVLLLKKLYKDYQN